MVAVAETGLIAQPQGSSGSGQMAIYDRVDPLKFIETMGNIFAQTGAGGADTLAKGQLLALACLSRRQDIFQLSDTYHLIKGKLSMKADVMLAKFRKAGGRHKWLKDGSDKIEAVGEFTLEGVTQQVSYSIQDAAAAQLLATDPKKAGNWEKNTAAMLRARVVSSAIRMLAPEVLEGAYCQEELESEPEPVAVNVISSAPSAASVVGVDQGANGAAGEKPVRKRRTAAEMVADAAKPTNQPQGDPAAAASQTAGQAASDDGVIEASYTATETNQDGSVTTTNVGTTETTVVTQPAAVEQPATTASTSAPQLKEAVFDANMPGTSTTKTLQEMAGLAAKLGANQAQLEAQLRNDPKLAGLKSLGDLSETQALAIVENLKGIVARAGK